VAEQTEAFLFGPRLRKAIYGVTSHRDVDCAVASGGDGAEESGAIITSANASTNGLDVDGAAVAAWEEAGYFMAQVDPIRDWFERLWRRSRPVADADLERAKAAWQIARA